MRKILCDRCGAEIQLKSRIGYVAVNWRAPSDESLMYENPYEGYDFCEQCMHDIVEVIDNVVPYQEEDKTEQETPEELARRFVNAMKEVSALEPEEPEEAESGSEEAAPEPEEPKMVKPKGWSREKKDIDMGKLGALRRAGWSVHKIADEFGVSDSVIRRRLQEVGE